MNVSLRRLLSTPVCFLRCCACPVLPCFLVCCCDRCGRRGVASERRSRERGEGEEETIAYARRHSTPTHNNAMLNWTRTHKHSQHTHSTRTLTTVTVLCSLLTLLSLLFMSSVTATTPLIREPAIEHQHAWTDMPEMGQIHTQHYTRRLTHPIAQESHFFFSSLRAAAFFIRYRRRYHST